MLSWNNEEGQLSARCKLPTLWIPSQALWRVFTEWAAGAGTSKDSGVHPMSSKPPERQDRRSEGAGGLRSAGLGVMIPTTMAACVIVGCLMGTYLDRWLGTKPWLFLLFLVFGIAAGARETVRMVRKIDPDSK
jgi:ATP synthase protein I